MFDILNKIIGSLRKRLSILCFYFPGLREYDFYVCGPMRGYKDLNKPMFILVTRLLRIKGFTVWSPSEHDNYLKLSFAQCMIMDLNAVINDCNEIVLLPGWRDSLGGNMEVFSAFGAGKKAFEIIMNRNKTDFNLVPINLSQYHLPYQIGETYQFDPHKCSLNSFEPISEV